jgi:hypothetical protein
MKLCHSPADTRCMYQKRLARDADPNASGPAPTEGAPGAFEDLMKFLADRLDPDDISEAETLLNRFVTGGAIGTDGDGPGGTTTQNGRFDPNPARNPAQAADEPGAAQDPRAMTMDQRLAVGAQIRAGRAQAQRHLFDQRFPNATRIRTL